ncbi:GNAT family N-acetyltransferase [Actinoplanes sp. NPDC023801]|uniref:GNAT family N-acetyltransferase n=1 Tax=Actinoplanes sp. NPDC023801 TaxID=3154595 RepID=UPI0033F09986
MDISGMALRAQVAWFRHLAARGFAQISTGDGFAVSTGLDSNTENGAVIGASMPDSAELDTLLGWLRAKAVPASVLVTGTPEAELTARLIAQGLHPERTGNNMGRLLPGFDTEAADPAVREWQILEVNDVPDLRRNQRVYAEDGWWDEPGELDRRVETAARLGFGRGQPIRHWTACHQGVPVGAATSFQFDDGVWLVHCCVAKPWRRHGIGTALTRVRLAAATRRGAVRAVTFPSPDGYHLHHSIGFELAPIHPGRCFYLQN